jgi:hypothetical protein
MVLKQVMNKLLYIYLFVKYLVQGSEFHPEEYQE